MYILFYIRVPHLIKSSIFGLWTHFIPLTNEIETGKIKTNKAPKMLTNVLYVLTVVFNSMNMIEHGGHMR